MNPAHSTPEGTTMANNRTGRRIFLVFLSIFILLMVAGTSILLLSTGVMEWAKQSAKLFVRTVHPLGKIRSVTQTVKSTIKKVDAYSLSALSPPRFPGSMAEKTDGVISWIDPTSARIPPSEHPDHFSSATKDNTKPYRISGLRGETASFQLVLRSDDPVRDLDVEIHPDQSDPNVSCLSIHRFLEWYEPIGKNQEPDPLIPFHDPYQPGRVVVGKVSLKSSSDQPVWIDIHFSRHCPAHNFRATLLVKNDGRIIRSTGLTISVLDATLPRQVGLDRWMQFYAGRFWHGESPPNDEAYRMLFYRYVKLGHDYGFATNDVDNIGPGVHFDWNTGKALSTDWSHYDYMLGPILSGQVTGSTPNAWALPIRTGMLGVGMWGGFTIHEGTSSPIGKWKGIPDTAAQELARVITEHWKEKGWPLKNAFAYAFDEPEHQLFYYQDIYKLVADTADSLHKGSHNQIRFMLTDAPYAWDRKQPGHHKSVMKGKVDIWSPNSETFMPDRMAKVQTIGERTWFYQSGPPFIGASDLYSTGVGFRMWFWAAWKYRTNGVFYWADDFWPDNTMAVNPYTNPGTGDGIIFYPGHQLHLIGFPDIDGPVPSIRMAQWRRGYDDYKYFFMLAKKGRREEVDKTVNHLVHKALDDGDYFPYWYNPLWHKPGAWSHNPEDWHDTRIKMAREIESLYGHSLPKN